MNELEKFAFKWCHPEHPPVLVKVSELDLAETQLGIKFPQDYREQILSVGLPFATLALSTSMLEEDIELPELSDMNQPTDIVLETNDWREIGMPEFLITIANDGFGNKFCFDERDLKNGKTTHAAVYFWDHDFDETLKISNSFSIWIALYLDSWSEGYSYKDF